MTKSGSVQSAEDVLVHGVAISDDFAPAVPSLVFQCFSPVEMPQGKGVHRELNVEGFPKACWLLLAPHSCGEIPADAQE